MSNIDIGVTKIRVATLLANNLDRLAEILDSRQTNDSTFLRGMELLADIAGIAPKKKAP